MKHFFITIREIQTADGVKVIRPGDKERVSDNVLDISKYTRNFTNRLGRHGRHGRKQKDQGITEITDHDCTNYPQDKGDAMERKGDHWYYYTSSEAIQLIKQHLTA